jgi:hypothetical protein
MKGEVGLACLHSRLAAGGEQHSVDQPIERGKTRGIRLEY